jgi:hypothetical protein
MKVVITIVWTCEESETEETHTIPVKNSNRMNVERAITAFSSRKAGGGKNWVSTFKL